VVHWTERSSTATGVSFVVTPYLGAAAQPTLTVGGGSSANVGNLRAGVPYTFTVTAQNTAGSATSVASAAVIPTGPSTGLGPHLFVQETGTCCSTGSHYGFVSQSNVPAMSHWTVEGYLFDENFTAQFSSTEWGLLAGTPSQPGGALVGIHMQATGGGPWFVWPGSTNQCGLPGGNAYLADAGGPTPAHFALEYDGTTVQGFINGALVCNVTHR
jgi:hypothetical protein